MAGGWTCHNSHSDVAPPRSTWSKDVLCTAREEVGAANLVLFWVALQHHLGIRKPPRNCFVGQMQMRFSVVSSQCIRCVRCSVYVCVCVSPPCVRRHFGIVTYCVQNRATLWSPNTSGRGCRASGTQQRHHYPKLSLPPLWRRDCALYWGAIPCHTGSEWERM